MKYEIIHNVLCEYILGGYLACLKCHTQVQELSEECDASLEAARGKTKTYLSQTLPVVLPASTDVFRRQ